MDENERTTVGRLRKTEGTGGERGRAERGKKETDIRKKPRTEGEQEDAGWNERAKRT